jgi:hypothetical protein
MPEDPKSLTDIKDRSENEDISPTGMVGLFFAQAGKYLTEKCDPVSTSFQRA